MVKRRFENKWWIPIASFLLAFGLWYFVYSSVKHGLGEDLTVKVDQVRVNRSETKEVVVCFSDWSVDVTDLPMYPVISNNNFNSLEDFSLQYKAWTENVNAKFNEQYFSHYEKDGFTILDYNGDTFNPYGIVEFPYSSLIVYDLSKVNVHASISYKGARIPYVYGMNIQFYQIRQSKGESYYEWVRYIFEVLKQKKDLPNNFDLCLWASDRCLLYSGISLTTITSADELLKMPNANVKIGKSSAQRAKRSLRNITTGPSRLLDTTRSFAIIYCLCGVLFMFVKVFAILLKAFSSYISHRKKHQASFSDYLKMEFHAKFYDFWESVTVPHYCAIGVIFLLCIVGFVWML